MIDHATPNYQYSKNRTCKDRVRKKIGEIKSADFAAFIQHINEQSDRVKIKKALDMLKKEEFHLYSDIDTDKIGGIVKSETDKELVYACRLDSNGLISCYHD